MPKKLDILERLGREFGFRHTTVSGAVQDAMTMNAVPARRLLKKLVEFKIDVPKKIDVVRFTIAHLLQKELKHRQQYGTSIMPFTERDYNGAVRKAKKDYNRYIKA